MTFKLRGALTLVLTGATLSPLSSCVQVSGVRELELSCGDTDSDPRNCGACGHDCLGSGCSAGRCLPRVMTPLPFEGVPQIVVSDDALFVSPAAVADLSGLVVLHKLHRIPKLAQFSDDLFPLVTTREKSAFTVDGGWLYLSSNPRTEVRGSVESGIYRCESTECPATQRVVAMDSPTWGVAVAAGRGYFVSGWADGGLVREGKLISFPVDEKKGPSKLPSAVCGAGCAWADLAIHVTGVRIFADQLLRPVGDKIFWVGDRGVEWAKISSAVVSDARSRPLTEGLAPKLGSPFQRGPRVLPGIRNVYDMAVLPDGVLALTDSAILYVPASEIENQASTPVTIATVLDGVSLVADSARVYWLESSGRLMACDRGGPCQPQVVVEGIERPRRLVHDERSLFWASGGDDSALSKVTLWRVAK